MADNSQISATLTREEWELINNSLNEVCHGVAIDDAEFSTRPGCSRQELVELLGKIDQMLKPS